MTTVVVTLTTVCSGGNHLVFDLSGDVTKTLSTNVDEMLSPVTENEKLAFINAISKMAKAGRTLNQAKTLLQAGVTVTV